MRFNLPTDNLQLATGNKSQSGFVALISAIIIALVLLIFVVGTGAGGFYTRFDVFGSEIKEVSYGLAEACVHTAILKASQDPATDINNEIVPVGDENCEIIEYDASADQIEAQGIYQNSYTNLRVIIDSSDFSVNSWEEVAEH
jgi:hypothetical protein